MSKEAEVKCKIKLAIASALLIMAINTSYIVECDQQIREGNRQYQEAQSYRLLNKYLHKQIEQYLDKNIANYDDLQITNIMHDDRGIMHIDTSYTQKGNLLTREFVLDLNDYVDFKNTYYYIPNIYCDKTFVDELRDVETLHFLYVNKNIPLIN